MFISTTTFDFGMATNMDIDSSKELITILSVLKFLEVPFLHMMVRISLKYSRLSISPPYQVTHDNPPPQV